MSSVQERLENFVHYDSRCAYPECYALEQENGPRFKQCSGCKAQKERTLYCSQECQKSDWPRHKPKCRIMAKISKVQLPMDNQQSKQLDILSHWKKAADRQLGWATREAFKVAPNLDPAQNFLQIELQDFLGPHGHFIAPIRAYFITKSDYVSNLSLKQGVTTDKAAKAIPKNPPGGRIVFLQYRTSGFLEIIPRGVISRDGFTGPLPSTPRWPHFLGMAGALNQSPLGFSEKFLTWEHRLYGWDKLGFEEVYSNMGEFSLEKGWTASVQDVKTFEEALFAIDANKSISDEWEEKLQRACERQASLPPPSKRMVEILSTGV